MYGLYYAYERALLSLPLLSVHAAASINDLAAQVNLTQTYRNDASFPIEAKYSFPIPARAAVSSFTMIKQDGTRIVGSVLEKFEAKQTYDDAVSKGQQASLMEQQTPDVFRVAVGNIPSHEQVQIELVYSTELAEDEESDSVRFHLPVHIGARYGEAPADFVPPPSSSSPFLTISTSVEALAPISNIGSPSHTVRTELGPDPSLPNFKDLPSSHYARVTLSSDTTLDKDFVLTFKSAGLDSPRCVAELHPTNDTLALALSLVPRFTLPDLARQEFILLVDRSGSMEGARIAAARKALIVLLSALPHKDTLFQIVSFGYGASSLWSEGSRPYNKATLAEATRHVDEMDADYGGTEIRAALEHAFAKRARDRPTSVLVLTDGDAWDLEGVLGSVSHAVEDAPEGAPLRVSVLGIGDGVSTAMCEGIARVGHGTFMLVDEHESSFAGKVARLLKAARTPVISNITVDWGRMLVEAQPAEDARAPNDTAFSRIEEEAEEAQQNKTLNVFDVDVDPTLLDKSAPPPAPKVILPPPPPVQQSPFKIRNIFPGSRLNVYAILQGQTVPESVTLRGVAPDGAVVELPVSVTLSRLPHAPGAPPALHALAARKLIQDLEDGQHELDTGDMDAELLERTLRAQIVRLGTTYQITSTHTSFVAIDEAQVQVHTPLRYERPPSRPGVVQAADHVDNLILYDYAELDESDFMLHDELGESDSMPFAAAVEEAEDHGVPQRYLAAKSESLPNPVSPLYRTKALKHAQPQKAPEPGILARLLDRIQFPFSAPSASTPPSPSTPTQTPAPEPLKDGDTLEALARLQAFDGAFPSPLLVLALVPLKDGHTLADVRNALPAGAADELVATVLALAHAGQKMKVIGLDGHDGSDAWAWAGMHEKASEWVEGSLRDMGAQEKVKELEKKVAAMLTVV